MSWTERAVVSGMVLVVAVGALAATAWLHSLLGMIPAFVGIFFGAHGLHLALGAAERERIKGEPGG